MASIPGKPPIEHPVVDPKTGMITPDWARWIMAFWTYVKGLP